MVQTEMISEKKTIVAIVYASTVIFCNIFLFLCFVFWSKFLPEECNPGKFLVFLLQYFFLLRILVKNIVFQSFTFKFKNLPFKLLFFSSFNSNYHISLIAFVFFYFYIYFFLFLLIRFGFNYFEFFTNLQIRKKHQLKSYKKQIKIFPASNT